MKTSNSTERIRKYLEFADSFPEHFPEANERTGICRSPEDIRDIERAVAAKYKTSGFDPEWAGVGVHYEDPYCILLRDAVRFRSGQGVIHHRVIWKDGPVSGVVVLPRLGDKYVLVRHYRHAVSSWSWECPRGSTAKGEPFEETVRKELHEEIGANLLACRHLGHMIPVNSFIDSGVDLFLADVDGVGQPATCEGIEEIRLLSGSELKSMICEGEITDASTICAVSQANFRGLLK